MLLLVPKSYAEQYRMVNASSMAAELGGAALALASKLEDAPDNKKAAILGEPLHLLLSDTLKVIEAASFELVDDIKHRRTPPQTFTELNNLSLGYSEEEAGDKRGVPKNTIKSWRKEIKAYMETRTRSDTVAEAIQRGLVIIEPDGEEYAPLSWMEDRVLAYSASGWTTAEIAEYFKLSPNTIDRHYEEIRRKLQARNMPHAVRRGFETGIFKVGKPIETASDTVTEMIIFLNSQSGEPVQLKLDDPREVDLLQKMIKFGNGRLTAQQAIEAEGTNEAGKLAHVGRTMLSLRQKLEAAAGEPVIAKSRLKIDGERSYVYVLNRSIDVNFGNRHVYLPAYQPEIHQTGGRPRSRKVPPKRIVKKPAAQPEAAKPQRVLPLRSERRVKPAIPDEIPAEKLPELTETLLRKLTPRDEKEVQLNGPVRTAMHGIARSGVHEYRGKVILFLRYGFVNAAPAMINRGGQYVDSRSLRRHIPEYRGLDVICSSLVSGLRPLAVLRAEQKLIQEYGQQHPALADLEELIQAEIKILETIEKA